ncbi:MAG: EAL domain-containing protein, partial [Thermodesulfobacteriaceae bacterium]|nr:EAL domain-containing protein [Thermodesulfobacteriaceae bacterium]
LQLLLAEALKRFSEFLIVVNKEGKILMANEKACELVKMSLNDLIGEPLSRFGFLIEDKNLEEFIKKGFLKETQKIPVKWISYEGHESWFEFDITRVKLSEEKEAYILTGETILRLVEFYEELKKAQAYDSLTGLLNYNGFVKAFSEKLSEVKRGLLILLDIYNFSYINHTYGFEYGDLCLKEVAHHFYREDFILSRIGSDNFAILKPFKEEEEAKKVIRWLQKKMKEPLWITVRTGLLTLSYHAAVVRFPEDGQNFETLWNRANLTLSKAKKKDPNTIEFFNPIYAEEVSHYLTKESLVKRALRENLFTFYYQPYFDLSNLKLVGLEALVRIKEKDGTLYLPLEFIEILEKCPYLQDFFKWSLREIKKKIFKWKIPISLNVSVNTLKMEENFNEIVTLVTSIKNKVGLDLDLEITERDFAENVAFMEKRISQLKASGVKIFLDDFGTGYSSLIYLKEFPLDVIKIDRIFIKDMLKGKKEMGLVKTAIDLAHTLGMKALAEGVETEEQLKILDIMGCDYVQGFYLAPPLPEEEVETFLKRQGLL